MYELNDNRLAELANRDDTSALQDELALARFISEKAAQQGQFGLSLAGLSTVAKLSSVHQSALIRSGQHLDRAAIIGIGRAASTILCDLVDALPRLTSDEKADFIDTFLLRFGEAVTSANNGERKAAQPLRLEHTK